MSQRTLPQLFEDSVVKYPDNKLMWENSSGTYEGATYKQTRQWVYEFAAGLQALGLKPGDRVALIAEGRNDWVIAELGILYCGAINVPVSIKIDEPAELKFRLAHAGCKMVIVSGSQRDKISSIKNDLPDLEYIINLDDAENPGREEIHKTEVMQKGKAYFAAHEKQFEECWQAIGENDYANICYTSGTTADPKGILLTHRNYTSNVEQSTALLFIPEHYVSLTILPLDHAFAHTVCIYTLMKNGAALAFVKPGRTAVETLRNIPGNILATKPHFILSVPTLAKSFRNNIENGIRKMGKAAEKLFAAALKVAYDYNGLGCDKGHGFRKLNYPLYKLFDLLLFKKVRENFGGNLEFFVGGGALLDIELQKFFYAIGIPMLQGYGLTEAAPVISGNVPASHKLGSSGKVVQGVEVKICDDKGIELPRGQKGEIVVRGENVMAGYWKNEKATAETIKDGWLFTGDLGYLGDDDFLYVLGRFKSLLIGNDGEKYSPEGIEEALTESSAYIEQVMLYNNQSAYTVALLVPDKARLASYLKELYLDHSTTDGQRAALKKIESEIAQFREGGIYAGMFPQRWLPSAVAVLGEGFNEQNHFLNSTLKMVRGKIAKAYKSRIDYLFTPEAKDICNHQNMTIVGRMAEPRK